MTERKLLAEDILDIRTSVFRYYRNYKKIGEEIKEDLFKSKLLDAEKDIFEFRMTDTNKKSGLLSQSYGIFLLSTLNDRFDVRFDQKEIEKLKKTVLSLVDQVNQTGYDISPFADKEKNKRFFAPDGGKEPYAFVESLTWVLSCLLYARRMHKNVVSDGKNEIRYSNDELQKITGTIARILDTLVKNVIHEDNRTLGYESNYHGYLGWGPVTECTESSLYFSHSVCESFGDLEDTALGNIELEIERDEEFIAGINEAVGYDVVGQFTSVCADVGKNMFNKFKALLGKTFFLSDGSEVKPDQIGYSIQSRALLNQVYVVLSAIYTNYYKGLSEDDFKQFSLISKSAVDLVYETYVNLKKKGKNSIVDREYVTFSENHPNRDISRYLGGLNERINVSILEALIVKARSMIVTYVTQYPEKEIDAILDIIEENHDDKAWIWNEFSQDLQQTERCVSAIREFYDYFEIYVKPYAAVAKTRIDGILGDKEDEIEKLKKEKDYVVSELSHKLESVENEHKEKLAELEELRRAEIQRTKEAVQNENKVENAVKERIKESVQAMVPEFIKEALDSSEDAFGMKAMLTDFLKSTIKKTLEPIAKETVSLHEDRGWESADVLVSLSSDLKAFIKSWMDELIKQNTPNAKQTRFNGGVWDRFENGKKY